MKMMKRVALFATCTTLLIGCQKEEITTELLDNESVEVTHHYISGDKKTDVVYTFNAKDQLIATSGDIKGREVMLQRMRAGEDFSMLVEEVSESGKEFTIRFFNSGEEMNDYQGIKEPTPQNGDDKSNPCFNSNWSGYASFRFYKHTNYVLEKISLRQPDKAYFQDHHFDSYTENDQISSLHVDNGSVDLFANGCFYGLQIRIQGDIPNLHWFFASSLVGSNLLLGKKPNVFFPANRNFGDQASSMKGWSL
jgi:hypothetical protein